MSLNDKDISLGGNKGVDLHPGVANPTTSSTHADPLAANFVSAPTTRTLTNVTDPTSEEVGAGAPSNFDGDRQAKRNFSKTAGVIESRPGIIETTNIDPLNEHSNDDDGWANAINPPKSTGTGASRTTSGLTSTATSAVTGAASMATGAAKLAYGHVAGDEAAKQAGKEAVWGKQ
ncbi:hypothetical protein GLOTRDRAFT_36620 [Gloeophyllum trabeum ATCC 11539]|uniref:Uncharacterized protein n=1 Tax=Gloeophyllum trabeum (strain ATCC 11539 / FP-39264 / Madison 617) TaxID=670483 RepID=S7QH58_GLOTA|nr:uncharacterized protein GLOTRDRAFT_36620 [Gloeophyllum trabeum ATCC 11539]EPQ58583.1 hypothetical protein GLOTRDRAFT_36620 [Gloeophyllum trabeum ATCC 11539]